MRPRRLELEGFSAFRDRAEIDFADADLFALVGPTGAGKSSVIDAMVFALYGSVPRYDSENLVHPVITQGATEARVRLDFTVDGVGHVATRVVRRTKTGATTKEARLERVESTGDTTVLADDAKGLTAAVAALLGLDLEQFTKCVVLPQGAFATLLHDTKAKRQDLLVKLLDLGVYEQVATAARAEAKRCSNRIELLDEQLARSSGADDTAIAAAEAAVVAVDEVVGTLDEAAPTLAGHDDDLRRADDELRSLGTSLAALEGVQVPADVTAIAGRAAEAAAAADEADTREAATATAAAEAEATLAALPAPDELRAHQRNRVALADLEAKVATGTTMVAELEAELPPLRAALEGATAALAAATESVDRARISHAAAAVTGHVQAGDDCPVCGNRIDELVQHDRSVLADAEQAHRAAVDAERRAATDVTAHETKFAEFQDRLRIRIAERDEAARSLVDAPGPDDIERALIAIGEADSRLVAARKADADARQAAKDARSAAELAGRRVAEARVQLVATRDRLASLGPPPVDGDDLAVDWSVLLAWSADQREAISARVAETTAAREATTKQRTELTAILLERAHRAGVQVADPDQLRDRCVTAAATAQARLDQLRAERERVGALRAERAELDERRQVHELLAEQLGARGFEAWLLDEALDALLIGASTWLEQLSSGRYAMTVDDKNQFAVVDHANADERRLARTLSGGETFLASLALALALAERVSELSALGGASLDAIFLDEGFGTLDPATLDVVATAIEELGATGRMVGVISHVRELAERVPVRFEISKQTGTSVVRRVEA